jgi:hypothetical protein
MRMFMRLPCGLLMRLLMRLPMRLLLHACDTRLVVWLAHRLRMCTLLSVHTAAAGLPTDRTSFRLRRCLRTGRRGVGRCGFRGSVRLRAGAAGCSIRRPTLRAGAAGAAGRAASGLEASLP